MISFAGVGLTLYDLERGVEKVYVLESPTVTGIAVGREFQADYTPSSVVLETPILRT